MSLARQISLSELEVARFLFAVVLLLVSALVLGHVFHRLRMPRVIGEIGGGLLLGPSVLGYFLPDAQAWIFMAFEAEGKLLSMVYWLGLVLLMFVSGFEIEKRIDRDDRPTIAALLVGATALPLVAGWVAPMVYDFSPLLGPEQNMLALRIVIAVAVAVTSIPVISKIFLDLEIIHSRFAKVVLAAATIQDVLLWVVLAVATGLVAADAPSVDTIVLTVVTTLAFFGVALLIMPRWVAYSSQHPANLLARSSRAGYVLFICFFASAVASALQVNIVFGAFLAGIIVGTIRDEHIQRTRAQIREVSMGFFIPIYFAIVGLKLDLVHHLDLSFLLGFLLFSTMFEALGTMVAVRLVGQGWLASVNFGMAMNARGGPGIVLATVAFELGIINETFFVALVLIAIITSLVTGSWLRLVLGRGGRLMDERPASAALQAGRQ